MIPGVVVTADGDLAYAPEIAFEHEPSDRCCGCIEHCTCPVL